MGNQFKNMSRMAVLACHKVVLFNINIGVWLTGLSILLFGIWAEMDLYKYMELSPELSGMAPHVMIGIASLIVFISSFAFSCIIQGQPVLLYMYGGFLACIFMMDIGFLAAVLFYKPTFAIGLHDGLTQTIVNYDPQKANFDFAQSTLHCCGATNYSDWMRLSPQRVIPISCCIDTNHCVTANYSDVYQRGCYEVIMEHITCNMNTLIVVAVGTSLLPCFGSFISCSLARYLEKSKYDVVN